MRPIIIDIPKIYPLYTELISQILIKMPIYSKGRFLGFRYLTRYLSKKERLYVEQYLNDKKRSFFI